MYSKSYLQLFHMLVFDIHVLVLVVMKKLGTYVPIQKKEMQLIIKFKITMDFNEMMFLLFVLFNIINMFGKSEKMAYILYTWRHFSFFKRFFSQLN